MRTEQCVDINVSQRDGLTTGVLVGPQRDAGV